MGLIICFRPKNLKKSIFPLKYRQNYRRIIKPPLIVYAHYVNRNAGFRQKHFG
jgi:hypothetical protein